MLIIASLQKKVLENLEEYKEVNLFLMGIFPIIGYKSYDVYYEINERFAGESKYSVKKMISFAIDGITSFSVKPIKLVFNSGIIITIVNILILLILFFLKYLIMTFLYCCLLYQKFG